MILLVVVDSSVLIALAKIGRLEVLRLVFDVVLIPPAVKIEVIDQGRAVRAPEVGGVSDAAERRWLRVGRLTVAEKRALERLEARSSLGRGESEAIVIAESRKLPLVVDDSEARHLAAGMGLEYLGTTGVLLEALRRGFITPPDFEGAIRDLAKVLWISPDVVAELLRRAREVKR